MQITLPDDPKLMASGFDSVEAYVWHLLEREATAEADHPAIRDLPPEQWKREFDRFLARQKPRNARQDDSRESIYSEQVGKQMLIDEDAR